jgi:NaMN:DMB phosphoribosyltransferase
MPWFNFRASRPDSTIYWAVSDNPISGDDRMNIEVPAEAVASQAAIDRLIAQAAQVELCQACDGATVSLGVPYNGVGYHAPECWLYYGWTTRDYPWTPRNLTPEPTPEPPN